MLNTLFFVLLVLYFAAMLLQFAGAALKKEKLQNVSWIGALITLLAHTVYTVAGGISVGRLPLANQFEFANAFGWAVLVIGVVFCMRSRKRFSWMLTLALPVAFLILSYAALCTNRTFNADIMPSLRSAWFGLHIGSAAFSYSAFALAGAVAVRYLVKEKQLPDGIEDGKFAKNENGKLLRGLDNLSYRLICFGFLLLSVVIISGCIWAEQAWNTFWSWDPKETWALITWIIYALYLHQRIRKKQRGRRMAWFAIIAVACVIFTFAGVNTLMKGLHSYAE